MIAEEVAGEQAAVGALHRAAFGGGYEAAVVERMRRSGSLALSLVARCDGEVLGHIMFSALAVAVDGRGVDAVALAPLAVRPDRQGEGIGTLLVVEGLARMRAQSRRAVFVRGSPAFYHRFGFSAATIRHLAAPWSRESYMGLELVPGALGGRAGTVRYPAAFSPPSSGILWFVERAHAGWPRRAP